MAQALKWEGGGIHARTYWSDGVWAGIIAGAVFMILQMLLMWLLKGMSPWGPPRMMAAIVMGQGALPPPATFAFGVMAAAMMVHAVLSIMYGLIGAWLVHRSDLGVALLIGAAFGLGIYIVHFEVLVPTVFSWFVMSRGTVTIVTHIIFGMVVTGSYIALRRRHLPA